MHSFGSRWGDRPEVYVELAIDQGAAADVRSSRPSCDQELTHLLLEFRIRER